MRRVFGRHPALGLAGLGPFPALSNAI